MRTAMAGTSLEAYRTLSIANLENKEREVMAEFFTNPGLIVTREALAHRLGWKESAVCGRANSLVTKGVLEEIEGGRTSTGRKAKLLRLPVAGQQDFFSMTAAEASGQRISCHVGTPSPYQDKECAGDSATRK